MSGLISAPVLLDLLPRDLRGELCIAGITVPAPGTTVAFRMDPGRAFERHGTVAVGADGRYAVVIADRHRPGDPPGDVAGAWGMTAAEVPDELRAAAARAWSRAAARPHWRDTFGDEAPRALALWPGPYATPVMTRTAARTARETGATCFFCPHGGWNACLTVPPRDAATFLSVTPEGAWALHRGVDTYPLTGQPGGAELAVLLTGGPVDRLQPVGRVPAQVRHDVPGASRPPRIVPAQRGSPRNAGGTRKNQRKGTGR